MDDNGNDKGGMPEDASPVKIPYSAPAIAEEEVFDTFTLGCSKRKGQPGCSSSNFATS
jgi:hypothetical protein